MLLVLADPGCPGQILESQNNNNASEFIKFEGLPYPYKFIASALYGNHSLPLFFCDWSQKNSN